MPDPLTQLERRIFHYLIDFLADNTFQPSIREIATKFRIKSTKTVSDLLQSIERKGYITRDASRSRGVRLLGYAGPGQTQAIPLYGRVHAGEPALRPEHRQGYITADRRFLPTDDVFVVRASGGGMSARAILDGDFVICSPSVAPNEGDMVAARVGDQATIRMFSNGARDSVLGVVCGVFRPFAEREVLSDLRDDDAQPA